MRFFLAKQEKEELIELIWLLEQVSSQVRRRAQARLDAVLDNKHATRADFLVAMERVSKLLRRYHRVAAAPGASRSRRASAG